MVFVEREHDDAPSRKIPYPALASMMLFEMVWESDPPCARIPCWVLSEIVLSLIVLLRESH